MSKKRILIILAVIFSIFITVFIFVMCNRPKEAPPIVPDKYAADNYVGYHPPTESTAMPTDESGNVIIETYKYKEITWSGLNYLTPEQKADQVKIHLYDISSLCAGQIYTDSPAQTISILPTSNEDRTYLVVTYEDGHTEEMVASYDAYTTHNYMRCASKEYVDYIDSGANAWTPDYTEGTN